MLTPGATYRQGLTMYVLRQSLTFPGKFSLVKIVGNKTVTGTVCGQRVQSFIDSNNLTRVN